MFSETTISYVKIWNHPIETTIYKWLALGFQVHYKINPIAIGVVKTDDSGILQFLRVGNQVIMPNPDDSIQKNNHLHVLVFFSIKTDLWWFYLTSKISCSFCQIFYPFYKSNHLGVLIIWHGGFQKKSSNVSCHSGISLCSVGEWHW